MPGVKGRSGGKNRKPTAALKKEGGYRESRHGGRADAVCNVGNLKKPDNITDMQSELWDAVVETLPKGLLGKIDSPMLLGLVRWYEVYSRAMTILEQDPSDTDAMNQAGKAWDRFWRTASEFGIGPSNRARLQAPPQDTNDENPFHAILSRKASAN